VTDRVWNAMLVGVMLVLSLTGCSPVSKEESVTMTLEQAKQALWQVEDELIAQLPPEVVTERTPRKETSPVIFECGPPTGGYTWPSGTQVGIDPATDSSAVLTAIHDRWASKPDWQVSWVDTGAEGQYHLDLRRQDGLEFGLMNVSGNTQLHFGGFSPCFQLDDYDPNRSY